MAEKWVGVSEACQLLQVSERTLYRKIKDGKIESRMTDNSHREVLVAVPMTKEEIAEGHLKLASDTVDNQLKIVATALGSTELVNKRMQAELDFVKTELGRVRENAMSEIVRVQEHSSRQVDYIKTEMIRSRRMGLIGWGVSGALVAVLLIVSIMTVKKLSIKETQIEVARADADSSRQIVAVVSDRVTDKERVISRLEADIAAIKSELTDSKVKLAALALQNVQPANMKFTVQPFRMMTDIPATMTVATMPATTTQPDEKITAPRLASQPVGGPTSKPAGVAGE